MRQYTIREHDTFKVGPLLKEADLADLEAVAKNVLKHRDGDLAASKYVGVLTTKRGVVVEILPKIDLGHEPDHDHEITRGLFLRMLRPWRRFKKVPTLPPSDIRAMRRFPMLEVFARQFLDSLNTLARGGLARRYIPVEENLPYLRGRLLFRDQIRENLTNQARFYVSHDELSVNRPANRLIHTALTKLNPLVGNPKNRRLLQRLRHLMEAADVPQAANTHADWHRHQVDRSMPHYKPVMQWVGLFLFGQGLTTFAGRHRNLSLLFPMEEVFEDFVTYSFRRYQPDYSVTAQGSKKPLATKKFGPEEFKSEFVMKPDILLRERKGEGTAFILDAKWKEIQWKKLASNDRKRSIDQDDLYQLYAYGKGYGCKTVALVYPQTQTFSIQTKLSYRLPDDVTLICLPFDVKDPEGSVRRSMDVLTAA